MFYLIWKVVIIGSKRHIWPYFMLIKVRNYLAPNFTTGDFRIRVRGPPANYVYGSHMTLVTRGSLGYSSHQKGVIQGHLVHRYASRRAPALCSIIMFRTVLSLDVSAQTVSYIMSVKYIKRGYFSCFVVSMLRTGNYVKQMKSIRFFNPSSVIYIRRHRWILALLLIFVDWYKHSNTNFAVGFRIEYGVLFEEQKRFLIKMSTLYNGLH